jgi:hypothetical protein
MYGCLAKKSAKYSFFGKIKVLQADLGLSGYWQHRVGRVVFGVKTRHSADFTIKTVPLQTILCGFVKVRLNNF